ncbi:MAG: hypothetical protein U0746_21475 [Gemmataceae bacterium]
MPTFACPSCAARIRMPDSARGGMFDCPHCSNPFSVGAKPRALSARTVLTAPRGPDNGSQQRGNVGIWVFVGGLVIGSMFLGIACVYLVMRQPAASARPAVVADEPADVPCAHMFGDVKLAVSYATVDRTLYRNILDQPAESADVHLNVYVAVANMNPARKIGYTAWSIRADGIRLTDDLGNAYRRIDMGLENGLRNSDTTLYSDRPIPDLIVFERPVPAAKVLTLELPAANFGGSGVLRCRFDATMLTNNRDTLQRINRDREARDRP